MLMADVSVEKQQKKIAAAAEAKSSIEKEKNSKVGYGSAAMESLTDDRFRLCEHPFRLSRKRIHQQRLRSRKPTSRNMSPRVRLWQPKVSSFSYRMEYLG
jgi:hypothetical protein